MGLLLAVAKVEAKGGTGENGKEIGVRPVSRENLEALVM